QIKTPPKKLPWGHTLLGESKKSLDMLKFLIDKGANINASFNTGTTLLNAAVIRGDLKLIELFLKNGADINRPNKKQITPLALGKLDTVRYLLENHGEAISSKNITDSFGYACKKGHLDVAMYIFKKRRKDISKKNIPHFLEKTKKTMQKKINSINKALQIPKIQNDKIEREKLEKELEDTTSHYGKIINLLKTLEQ
ncbi:ankyrin repeat domain-containing protein, partial [Candidatus Dependentiae bacterium]